MIEPKIERVSFDQIEEFKDLNTEELTGGDKLYSIMFDPNTGLFKYTQIYDGFNITNINSKTTSAIAVVNPNLGVPVGAILPIESTMDDLATFLLDPPTEAVYSMSLDKSIIRTRSIEQINVSYSYMAGDRGAITSVKYFKDNVVQGSNIIDINENIEKQIEIKVIIDTDDTGTLGANQIVMTKTLYISAVEFFGTVGGTSRIVTGADFTNPYLSAATDAIFNYPALVAGVGYFWFAALKSKSPSEWISINTDGSEDAINRGTIPGGLFALQGEVTHVFDIYEVYIVADATAFSTKIKIKL